MRRLGGMRAGRGQTLRCIAVTAALALAGCGSQSAPGGAGRKSGTPSKGQISACARYSAFTVDPVRDRGGAPTPVAAAERFARVGGVRGIPRGGWRLRKRRTGMATISSRQTVLEAYQLADATWQIVSGFTCQAG